MYCGYTHTRRVYTHNNRVLSPAIFFVVFFLKVLDVLALNVLAPTSRSSIGQDERGNTQERRSDAPFTIILSQRNRAGKREKKNKE